MRANEHKTILKVVAGYVVVTLVAGVIAWLLYSTIVGLISGNKHNPYSSYQKSMMVNEFVLSLYQTEYQTIRLSYNNSPANRKEYEETLLKAYLQLDSIKERSADKTQKKVLEELRQLLAQRGENTIEMLRLNRHLNQDKSIERSIERIIESSKVSTGRSNTEVRSHVITDTIKEGPVKRKNFFQRLGYAFAPQKSADTAVVKIERVEKKDITHYIPKEDSVITSVLQLFKEEVVEKRTSNSLALEERMRSLMATQQAIGNQIGFLIVELNAESSRNTLKRVSERQERMNQVIHTAALLAVAALMLIFLFLLLTSRDITRSVRYRLQLEEARKQAEELMKSRQKMLFNISHDIKAPLCSITGYVDMLKEEPIPKLRQWASSMQASANYILDLLTTLLEYARIESGQRVVNPTTFDADSLIDEIAEVFTPMAAAKDIWLHIKPTQGDIGYIESDSICLRQIVMNLVSNAIKFTDNGGVSVDYSLSPQGYLVVEITDTGCGIGRQEQNIIFEEFGRSNDAETQGREGSGLGLAVVKGLTELLGGKILLESTLGEGSKFTVEVPVIRREKQIIKEVAKTWRSLRILCVDDDVLQLNMEAEMLRRMGHEVKTAAHIEAAVEELSHWKTELVLTDIQMGVSSGYDLLHRLRAVGYTMPVIAVSAQELNDKKAWRRAGFDDFLCKPFSLLRLKQTIEDTPEEICVEELTQMMEGDATAVEEIITVFIDTSIDNREQLLDALQQGNEAACRKICHRMLPMFIQLGIGSIAQLLKEVDGGTVEQETLLKIADKVERVIIRYRNA